MPREGLKETSLFCKKGRKNGHPFGKGHFLRGVPRYLGRVLVKRRRGDQSIIGREKTLQKGKKRRWFANQLKGGGREENLLYLEETSKRKSS